VHGRQLLFLRPLVHQGVCKMHAKQF
jgi:hypothetical protein